MVERRRVVEMWRQGRGGVLITLVRAEGSSYRRPGARLLTGVMPDRGGDSADYAGTISGGCLESEVVRKAAWMTRNGAVVERYSMLFDDTAEIPFGLGCGGVVDLLFEPLGTPEAAALLAAMEGSLAGRESTVVSFLPGGGRTLRRLVLDDAGTIIFASAGLSEEKIVCARRLNPGEDHEGRFVERLRAPQRLFVLGAGDDARSLVQFAALLGWSVTVADGRASLARAERFPPAERVLVLVGRGQLEIEPDDAVVLMTHSYEQDRELLAAVLPLRPRYLGLLGSRHRSSLLVSEVAARLQVSIEACCRQIFAPVGMDLGGDGPEAISLAIVAEVQAVCHGRGGVRQHLTLAEVTRQLENGGASRYMQVQCAMDTPG
jgi:xanthine/CO dehydrogenase XdhC/CoxF family maturation factor